jgi:hypothetical protein
MDLTNSLFPSDQSSAKTDIYFDDMPEESFIYLNESLPKPTPADIVTLWSEGFNLTNSMQKILIGVLASNITIAFDMNRVKEAESLLKAEVANRKCNVADKITILIALFRLNEKTYPVEGRTFLQKAKKLMHRYSDKIDAKTMNEWNSLWKMEIPEVSPYQLRSVAFEKLQRHEYDDAEKIYRQMIEMDFELPGTLCHLARVQLLKHREQEAELSIQEAWKLRDKASKYVIPRIIYFKILFALFENKTPRKFLIRLKSALQEETSFMDWTMKPTVIQYQSRLTPENFQMLMVLTEVLQEFKNRELLNQFM